MNSDVLERSARHRRGCRVEIGMDLTFCLSRGRNATGWLSFVGVL